MVLSSRNHDTWIKRPVQTTSLMEGIKMNLVKSLAITTLIIGSVACNKESGQSILNIITGNNQGSGDNTVDVGNGAGANSGNSGSGSGGGSGSGESQTPSFSCESGSQLTENLAYKFDKDQKRNLVIMVQTTESMKKYFSTITNALVTIEKQSNMKIVVVGGCIGDSPCVLPKATYTAHKTSDSNYWSSASSVQNGVYWYNKNLPAEKKINFLLDELFDNVNPNRLPKFDLTQKYASEPTDSVLFQKEATFHVAFIGDSSDNEAAQSDANIQFGEIVLTDIKERLKPVNNNSFVFYNMNPAVGLTRDCKANAENDHTTPYKELAQATGGFSSDLCGANAVDSFVYGVQASIKNRAILPVSLVQCQDKTKKVTAVTLINKNNEKRLLLNDTLYKQTGNLITVVASAVEVAVGSKAIAEAAVDVEVGYTIQ